MGTRFAGRDWLVGEPARQCNVSEFCVEVRSGGALRMRRTAEAVAIFLYIFPVYRGPHEFQRADANRGYRRL